MSLQLACVLPLYQIPSCNWKLARDSHEFIRTYDATSLQRKKKNNTNAVYTVNCNYRNSFPRRVCYVFFSFFFVLSSFRTWVWVARCRGRFSRSRVPINKPSRVFLVVPRKRHREGKDLRARVRDRPDRQSMARQKSMAKSESDEIKKQKKTKTKERKAKLRSILWLVEVAGPAIIVAKSLLPLGFESLDFQTWAFINLLELLLRNSAHKWAVPLTIRISCCDACSFFYLYVNLFNCGRSCCWNLQYHSGYVTMRNELNILKERI